MTNRKTCSVVSSADLQNEHKPKHFFIKVENIVQNL